MKIKRNNKHLLVQKKGYKMKLDDNSTSYELNLPFKEIIDYLCLKLKYFLP
jgi:hypothetical protein